MPGDADAHAPGKTNASQADLDTAAAAASASPRILGIDPGLNITGYGVLEIRAGRHRVVEAGVIRGTRGGEIQTRLAEIHRGVTEVIQSLRPDVMAIEQLYSHYDRPRTAILMGHARGVICLAAAQAGIALVHYASTQVKSALTGNGRAPKNQIQMAICREFGLAQPPEPPDVADALAIALCHVVVGRNQDNLNKALS